MIEVVQPAARPTPAARVRDRIVAYFDLTKPGIVLYLLITCFAGMVVAQGGFPPLSRMLWTLLGLALSAGGANAINMWYDRDIDRVMRRTVGRPLPTGRLTPVQALRFGIGAGVLAFALLALTVNVTAAALAAAGYLFYVLVYTFWLKRRTPQNIVIGGAAGAFPPLVGWAAVTGQVGAAALLMFLIIFLWTPPHFWALAIRKQEDYRAANIPMMPIARGSETTKRQMVGYAVVLTVVSLLLYATGAVGMVYLVAAVLLGTGFITVTLRLMLRKDGELEQARTVFRYSLIYMSGIFIAMMIGLPPH